MWLFAPPPSTLRVLSICTGYGGLERAIRIARPGVRLVGAVERQAYPAAVLASRMVEGAMDPCPIWDDLESFDGSAYRGRVDLIAAGFPCQGASVAGKRLGTEDERWLWPEVWRVTIETGARWLFAENVSGLLSVNGGAAFEEILRDLDARGWAAEWDCFPAGTIGAPHIRDRAFILAAADTDNAGCASERNGGELDRSQWAQRWLDADGCAGPWSVDTVEDVRRIINAGKADWDRGRAPQPTIRGVDDGAADPVDASAWPDQIYVLGNGVVPQAAAVAFVTLWERLHGAALNVRSQGAE
jgi:DNA (cytosine-5)-methyltransferase 1